MCAVTRSPCGNPAASHSLCVSARPVGETSLIATLQASATSWRTSSRPIPLPPPVTTAVLPANSVMCAPPWGYRACADQTHGLHRRFRPAAERLFDELHCAMHRQLPPLDVTLARQPTTVKPLGGKG